MDKLDNISENEIRIVGQQPAKQSNMKKWLALLAVIAILVIGGMLWWRTGKTQQEKSPVAIGELADSVVADSSYVIISDTMINNVSLHRFIPVNAKPKLKIGLIKEIPSQYVLGAMAADFGIYEGKYQVVGSFVIDGEMKSHSKSKYGFCAVINDTVLIGKALSTSYFERAIEEKGDFFRQHALIHDGKVVNSVLSKNESLRRALCKLSDGRVCIIDTDMSVSLDAFSEALLLYDVQDAIALMGSGAAVRWAVDNEGRRFIAGADEYDFPDVVNYIVWEKTRE